MTLKDRNILVIDDAPPIRSFLRISLEGLGATFYEAATAMEGIELCRRERPDLVVLDLGLPDRDGLDILPEITLGDGGGRTPAVVVLTVRNDVAVVDKALQRGALAYVTKPFMMEDLLEVIEHHIPAHRSAV